jgi:Ca-activated chloride channel family protein
MSLVWLAAVLLLCTQLARAQPGDAWVPGGIKAFARMAHLQSTPLPRDFFLEYCRALIWEQSPWNRARPPGYTSALQAYIDTVAELQRLGEGHGDSTVVTVSLADDSQRRNAESILPLLGWKLVSKNSAYTVEPGDRPADGLRQQIPSALGIDEIAMQETLNAGREFQFAVPSENAPLIAAARWSALPNISADTLAEALSKDLRLAKVYAALAAMGEETADAVIASLGLRTLALVYPEVLASCADAFTVYQGQVETPGGAAAKFMWVKLVGSSPRDPPGFFRALLQKDHGSLAAFYHALARADAPHQRFFTETVSRVERFYAWYRDSGEVFLGMDRRTGSWRTAFFQNLPLDDAGHIRFPGGVRAWTASSEAGDETLLDIRDLEALVPVARLEADRHAPLDESSAKLLAQHFSEWRPLFPYFEKLPGLGSAEFQALAAFSGKLAARPAPERSAGRNAERNEVMGEWHSLVELIVLGTESGALDRSRGARVFRHVCTDLAAADHSAKALALLREMAGRGEDLDDAVPRNLLRLSGERRADFDRVRELQMVPRLGTPLDSEKTLPALGGLVYAALLHPDQLLVAEDPLLPGKHRFVESAEPGRFCLFCPSDLVSSSAGPGSYLRGGFMTLDQVAKNLARGGRLAEIPQPAALSIVAPDDSPGDSSGNSSNRAPAAVFRTSARLVEVYATVSDERGRYIDGLNANDFTVLENGKPVPTIAFEARASSLSVALLFDTTGSMLTALPALKSAALKLIGDLRPIDWVSVYSFSDSVHELLPFTTDKNAARRAVLRTRAFGGTALYDALVRVNCDLAARSGKKVIVVFTDGADNSSVLTTQTAIERARKAGTPIYTIAQGEALQTPALLKQLAAVSRSTGGVAFAIHSTAEISLVFDSVSQDLTHGYLLAFQPPAVENNAWRSIEVVLRGSKGRKVRAREGYFPD